MKQRICAGEYKKRCGGQLTPVVVKNYKSTLPNGHHLKLTVHAEQCSKCHAQWILIDEILREQAKFLRGELKIIKEALAVGVGGIVEELK